jgi:hypothetical protein
VIHINGDVAFISAEEYTVPRNLGQRSIHVSGLTKDDLIAWNAVEIPSEATLDNKEAT